MRERRFGDEIVREPVRQLGERIGCQRRDHEQIGPGEMNVEILRRRLSGQRKEGFRSDETLRTGGDQRDDLVARLHEQANQVASLIGGDSTGDADQHSSHAGILPFWQRWQQAGERRYFGYLYLSLPSATSSRAMVK